jgi:hypothetical protein
MIDNAERRRRSADRTDRSGLRRAGQADNRAGHNHRHLQISHDDPHWKLARDDSRADQAELLQL